MQISFNLDDEQAKNYDVSRQNVRKKNMADFVVIINDLVKINIYNNYFHLKKRRFPRVEVTEIAKQNKTN